MDWEPWQLGAAGLMNTEMGKNARTFGQDLMRGEGGGMSKQRLAPGGGGCWRGGPGSASSEKFGVTGGSALPLDRAEGQTGTSIFDPVLAELCYKWFCPPGGRIIDPFAGGSVRGVVASVLGYTYNGCELRAEQVAANYGQIDLAREPLPVWACDDSTKIKRHFAPGADFVFSCPPYANLEIYSDDPADLSNKSYGEFLEAYRLIITETCDLLNEDRFAAFVVGEVRDKAGNYLNFVGDTVEAFRAAGLQFYNEAILITAVGSLPVRVGKQFKAGRKLGKTHQNILVFVKGDGKKAAANIERAAA